MLCSGHVGCPLLGIPPAASTTFSAPTLFEQQMALRAKPMCEASRWEGRCPDGSSMLLDDAKGCSEAGCVQVPVGAAMVSREYKQVERYWRCRTPYHTAYQQGCHVFPRSCHPNSAATHAPRVCFLIFVGLFLVVGSSYALLITVGRGAVRGLCWRASTMCE